MRKKKNYEVVFPFSTSAVSKAAVISIDNVSSIWSQLMVEMSKQQLLYSKIYISKLFWCAQASEIFISHLVTVQDILTL